MIGRISGRLDWRGPDHVLIDVRGVGYIVHVSERTLAAMPPVGEAVSLYTDLLVREDLLQLFAPQCRIGTHFGARTLSAARISAAASPSDTSPATVATACAASPWP